MCLWTHQRNWLSPFPKPSFAPLLGYKRLIWYSLIRVLEECECAVLFQDRGKKPCVVTEYSCDFLYYLIWNVCCSLKFRKANELKKITIYYLDLYVFCKFCLFLTQFLSTLRDIPFSLAVALIFFDFTWSCIHLNLKMMLNCRLIFTDIALTLNLFFIFFL